MQTNTTTTRYSPEAVIARARKLTTTKSSTLRGACKALVEAKVPRMFGPGAGLVNIDRRIEREESKKSIRALRAAAAEGLAKVAEMHGVYVCAADSVTAGNCVAGTSSFALRHGLDLARHYSATEILEMGNGDTGRARLAIRAAITRTRRENKNGYALLADHTLRAS